MPRPYGSAALRVLCVSAVASAVEPGPLRGAKVLDDASVRTVLKAAPVPFVEGWVEVPMVYELKD